ncbi:MAG: hypothetical protein M3N43_14650 [Actinomycetota bacterium]|nr:hypothetical protein [Actinomycetota bacterium]
MMATSYVATPHRKVAWPQASIVQVRTLQGAIARLGGRRNKDEGAVA